jgi:hypothetical protein
MMTLMMAVYAHSAFADKTVSEFPAWNPPSEATFLSPSDIDNWSFGGFAGVYNHGRLIYFEVEPWRVKDEWGHGYMVAGNAVYKIAHLPYVPLDLELDLSVADLFGRGNVGEIGAIPEFRWKWFPWNNWIYTNVRLGPLGASYTTGLSVEEASDTIGNHTSRFLNLDVFEWTFAPSDRSNWEAFIRNQHRSGIFGHINGVNGGSNYVNLGLRVHF